MIRNSEFINLLQRDGKNNLYLKVYPGLTDLFQFIISEGVRLVGAKSGEIYTLNEDGQLTGIKGRKSQFQEKLANLSFSERKSYLIRKGEFIGKILDSASESYIVCYLGQETGDMDIGVFVLEGILHFENFSYYDFELISVFCSNLSLVMKDALISKSNSEIYLGIATSILLLLDFSNAFQKNSRSDYLLKEVIRVSGLINSSLELNKLLNAVMESVKSVFKTESCSILLVDQEKQELYFHIVAGEKSEEISKIRVPIGQGIAGTIAVTKKPMIINDAQNDPRVFRKVDKAAEFTTRNILGAALVVNDEVIGVMEAINTIDRNNFNSTDIELFLSFSDAAALAIQKTRLLENLGKTNLELQKKVSELESLFNMGQAVLDSKDELDLVQKALSIIAGELEATRISIIIDDRNSKKLNVVSQLDSIEFICEEAYPRESMIYSAIQNKKVQILNFHHGDDRSGGFDERFLNQSSVILPLTQTGSDTLGAIVISEKKGGGFFDDTHVKLLQTISSQIIKGYEGFKLHRAMIDKKAIEKELEITRKIQNNILPSPKKPKSNFVYGVKTVPAMEVSGDFYDFFQYNDGQFSFLVADVSGKSLPAAIFMAMSSSIIRTLSRDKNLSPEEVLRQANGLIYEDSQSGMFVTLFYINYNPSTSELSYASAGHNDQIWIQKDGSYKLLKGQGPPLGVIPKGIYRGGVIYPEPGDLLVLYTDGAIEEKNDMDEEFGLDRFIHEIQSRKEMEPQQIIDEMYSLIRSFSGSEEQFDDFTVLILKFNDDWQFQKEFSAEPDEIPNLRIYLEDAILERIPEEYLREDILLACDEAATNIIMHGYKETDIKKPKFTCMLKFTKTSIIIKMTDLGGKFIREEVKSPSIDANMRGERKGGFGVYLIEKLMDRVEYGIEGDKNVTVLEKKIPIESLEAWKYSEKK